jgi:hypothetical protein
LASAIGFMYVHHNPPKPHFGLITTSSFSGFINRVFPTELIQVKNLTFGCFAIISAT